MDRYVLMLLVTDQQEQAIKSLFGENNWTFLKTGSRSALTEELNDLTSLGRQHDEESIESTGITSHLDNDPNGTCGKDMVKSPSTQNMDQPSTLSLQDEDSIGLYGTESKKTGGLLNTQNISNKQPKHKWSINRNMKMHACHRKCGSIPQDLNSEQFSASQNGYFCPDCMFIFREKKKLVLHKQLKKGFCSPHCIYCDKDEMKRIFQCDLCPKCFSSQPMLDKHIGRHSRRFKCIICHDLEFYTVQELKFHQSKEHVSDFMVEYLCDLCGAKFHDKKVLNGHRKYVHTENRPEQCHICKLRFKNKSQLGNHQLCHKTLSEVNLSCEVCGKQFVRAGGLKDHIRRHKKDYSEFCTICDKGFYKKYSLEIHMRIHTGDKPYECQTCGFKTALSSNLIKHARKHKKPGKNVPLH